MEELEKLEVDLKDLQNACDNIVSALNNLKDVQGVDVQYEELDSTLQDLEDKMREIRIETERLAEEKEYEENKEQWKAEIREQQNEFDKMRL